MTTNKDCDLILTTKVWDIDKHHLLDYNCKNTIKKKFIINTSGIVSRINKEIIFSNENEKPKKEKNQILLKIIKNEENKYNINCGNWSKDLISLSNQTGAFMIYKSDFFKEEKSIKNKFYKLSQGDIIKLGKIYIKLLDMQLEEETNNNNSGCINSISNEKKLIRNLSYNSSMIKKQELLKGTFINDSKINGNNELSNNESNRDKLLFLSSDNKIKYEKEFDKQNNVFLPRINSTTELLNVKNKNVLKIGKSNENNMNFGEKVKDIKKNICRICYGENSIKENPLLCPCTCKGSMKYIHYLCLKNWLNSKIESEFEENLNENKTISYNKKDISCELCKTQFPDYIRYKGILYNISFYKPKFKEFLMFETLREDKTKYINIVSLENKKIINLGRSRDCDFSIPEISISRFHSIIHKNKNELLIEDNKSKFGTLILVQNDNIEINNNNPLKLQISRTYLKIKKNLSFFSYLCCNVNTNNTDNEKNDYENQNKLYLNVFSYFRIKDNNNIDLDNEEEKNLNNLNNYKNECINDDNANKFKIKKILVSNEDEITSEKNNIDKNNIIKDNINSINSNIEKEDNVFKSVSNEEINNMEIYKKNKLNKIKNFETNNMSYNTKTEFFDSIYNSAKTNNKKNNINLIIEDCNNKNLFIKGISSKNHTKMKKIKITNNHNHLINNEEHFLPNIQNNVKPLEHFLHSSLNTNNLLLIQNKNTLNFIEKNITSNTFNSNINKPKFINNENNIINTFINFNKKIINNEEVNDE